MDCRNNYTYITNSEDNLLNLNMNITFVKQNQITGKLVKGKTTLKEFVDYLDRQNLKDGIKIRYINGVMVIGWK